MSRIGRRPAVASGAVDDGKVELLVACAQAIEQVERLVDDPVTGIEAVQVVGVEAIAEVGGDRDPEGRGGGAQPAGDVGPGVGVGSSGPPAPPVVLL